MYTRLAKEFRALLLPWCVTAGAGLAAGGLVQLNNDWEVVGVVDPSLSVFATFGFFGGIGLLAALSFGTEFRQHTLCLLISQPLSRSRLWTEKMLVLTSAVVAALLLPWVVLTLMKMSPTQWAVVSFGGPRFPLGGVLRAGTCVVATVCATGFWTMIARSTIGGLAFSVASQFFLGLGVVFTLQKIYGPDLSFEEAPIVTRVIIIAGAMYSALFLWLGRCKFARFELRDVSFGESGFVSGQSASARWWSNWLRCRPTGITLNLIRKELLLQKPAFLIAAILSLCWLVTLSLLLLEPARKETFDAILNVITALFVAVLPLLAGCISLGEEKALGLTAWHLSLPISARRQWLMKLAVSLSVAVVLGFVLPFLLACLSALKTNAGLYYLVHEKNNGWPIVLALWELTFVMSFWSATLMANTLRAALASIISIVAVYLCGALAVWCALLLGPLETSVLVLPVAYFQLPVDFFSPIRAQTHGIPFVIGIIALVSLAQSLARFRRAQTPPGIIWKYSAILTAVVFLLAFWLADFDNSASDLRSGGSLLQRELCSALGSLPAKEPKSASFGWRKVTLTELEQTGKLSALTKAWLKNTSISFTPVLAKTGHSDSAQTFMAIIEFPNGRREPAHFQRAPIRQKEASH